MLLLLGTNNVIEIILFHFIDCKVTCHALFQPQCLHILFHYSLYKKNIVDSSIIFEVWCLFNFVWWVVGAETNELH